MYSNKIRFYCKVLNVL